MSEPVSVCVHVLLLVHCQPEKAISFFSKLCHSPVPRKAALLFQQHRKIDGFDFLYPPWCICGEKKHLPDEQNHVISHREGPRAAKLQMTDALHGIEDLPLAADRDARDLAERAGFRLGTSSSSYISGNLWQFTVS